MEVPINWLAVLLAGVSTMVVGYIWYAPKVFGNSWAKMAHVDMNRKMTGADMAWMYGSVFAASIVTGVALAYFAFLANSYFQNSFLQDTITVGLVAWLGFTALRIFTHDTFEVRRKKLTLMAAGYELVIVFFMSLIIGSFGMPS